MSKLLQRAGISIAVVALLALPFLASEAGARPGGFGGGGAPARSFSAPRRVDTPSARRGSADPALVRGQLAAFQAQPCAAPQHGIPASDLQVPLGIGSRQRLRCRIPRA